MENPEVNLEPTRFNYYKEALGKRLYWALILAVSAVFFGGDIGEKIIRPNVNPDSWKSWEWLTVVSHWPILVWLAIVLGVLLIGAIETGLKLYRGARKKGDEAVLALENYKTRQLELTWVPDEEPYRWWDMSQSPAPALYFRLRIKNICGVTIDGVKVELSELTPRALHCVPCPIRLMNNLLPKTEPVLAFSLNPGDKNFVDLMLQSRGLRDFWILHAVEGIDVKVPKQPYRMTIRVSAINVPEIVRTYQLVEDGEMWNMKEIP